MKQTVLCLKIVSCFLINLLLTCKLTTAQNKANWNTIDTRDVKVPKKIKSSVYWHPDPTHNISIEKILSIIKQTFYY